MSTSHCPSSWIAYNIGLCGTISVVESFRAIVDINNNTQEKTSTFGEIRFAGNTSVLVAKILYDNYELYLNRKCDVYKEMIGELIG